MKSNVATPLNKLFTYKRPCFCDCSFHLLLYRFFKKYLFFFWAPTQPAHCDTNWDAGDVQPHQRRTSPTEPAPIYSHTMKNLH